MLPLTDDADEIARLLDGVDGVLLPGGLDIDAHCYGEEPRPATESPYLPLDRHQMALVPQVLARDLPMLGIWMVNGEAVGMGIRESDRPITDYECRFAPHLVQVKPNLIP